MIDPSKGFASNKSFSVVGKPDGYRTWFTDPINGYQRPYANNAEVISQLNTPESRAGQFDIVINTGGTLSFGVITGGTNAIWYFKDGVSDGNLVLKGGISPITIAATQTGYTPIAIPTFYTTYAAYGAVPTIIVRESYTNDAGNAAKKWRTDIQPQYDTVLDIMYIDYGYPATGDITIKI